MTRHTKKVEQFIKNPTSLHYRDIEKILVLGGFEKRLGKGSHIKFAHPHFRHGLVVAVHNGDCKDVYKKEAKKLYIQIWKQ